MPNVQHKKTILVILGLGILVVGQGLRTAHADSATVAFLDVGQGDAILITMPGSVQVLVDGGPSDVILEKLPRYMPFYDKRIELVVLTHPHADHLSGINAVLRSYEIKNVLIGGVVHDSGTYAQFLELLRNENSQLYQARPGDEVRMGKETLLSVVAPLEDTFGKGSNDVNQTSVVSYLTLGGYTFLLTGDSEKAAEEELVRSGLRDVDVLKVGHQGSKNGTSREFLASVRPELAVISVGKNNYGHPSPETIERLVVRGAKVLRTDEEGDIVWKFRTK